MQLGKRRILKEAEASGYAVVLIFIGIGGSDVSETRVAMRVSQGGHDVPTDKLTVRYPRALANLRRALPELPRVMIFDNDDLSHPYRVIATFSKGNPVMLKQPIPRWLKPLL